MNPISDCLSRVRAAFGGPESSSSISLSLTITVSLLLGASAVLLLVPLGGSAPQAFDLISPAHNSTIVDPTPTLQWAPAGESGPAYLDFDGTNDYVSQSMTADTFPMTISLWYNWGGSTTDIRSFLTSDDGSQRTTLRINTAGDYRWGTRTSGGNWNNINAGSPTVGTWSQLS